MIAAMNIKRFVESILGLLIFIAPASIKGDWVNVQPLNSFRRATRLPFLWNVRQFRLSFSHKKAQKAQNKK